MKSAKNPTGLTAVMAGAAVLTVLAVAAAAAVFVFAPPENARLLFYLLLPAVVLHGFARLREP